MQNQSTIPTTGQIRVKNQTQHSVQFKFRPTSMIGTDREEISIQVWTQAWLLIQISIQRNGSIQTPLNSGLTIKLVSYFLLMKTSDSTFKTNFQVWQELHIQVFTHIAGHGKKQSQSLQPQNNNNTSSTLLSLVDPDFNSHFEFMFIAKTKTRIQNQSRATTTKKDKATTV